MRSKAMRSPDRTRQDSPTFKQLSINFVNQRLNIWIVSFKSLIEKKCPEGKKVLSGLFRQHE
jgi:hypothetical protein